MSSTDHPEPVLYNNTFLIIPFDLMEEASSNPNDHNISVFSGLVSPISQGEEHHLQLPEFFSPTSTENGNSGLVRTPDQELHLSDTPNEYESKISRLAEKNNPRFGHDEQHPLPVSSTKVTFLPEEKVLLDTYRRKCNERAQRLTIRDIASKAYKKLYIAEPTCEKIIHLRQSILSRFRKEGRNCRTCKNIETYYYNKNRRRVREA